jgi:ethanolamine utilization protein EutP (predicted NTPase)
MTKYVEMDRYNERYDTITLKQESFSSIIQVVEDDKLTHVAKEIASLIPKQFLLFWFKRSDLETYLRYLSLVCRYNGFGEYEVDMDEARTNYTITIIHNMGQKWSNFLKNWLEQGMKTTTGIIPKIDISKNTVVARFQMP